MSFSSSAFLYFFPIVTAIYFALPYRWRWLHLLVASCVFYMFFVPAYILILIFTIVVDYFAAIAIASAEGERRRRYLIVSLVANVGVLAVFKYTNFVIENVNAALALVHFKTALPLWPILLPVGLSFHTFQAMSYTIEVYRGNQEPERHFGLYALYVMFYPQLVAGPIERPQNLLHQFYADHPFDYDNVTDGLRQMTWGFLKKTVVAVRLGAGVDVVFYEPHKYEGIQFIIASVLFSVQVYADFSGYSDIALGAARVMGFRLMKNFDRPYGARNIAEFWRRWHISLFTWFTDYLYTPVVIATRDWGRWAIVFAVMLTFSLSGLWHGAAWTFVIWGVLHGANVTLEMMTRRWRNRHMKRKIWDHVGRASNFAFVAFTFIFFRAASVGDALWISSHLGDGLGTFLRGATGPRVWGCALRPLGFDREDDLIALLSVALMFGVESLHARFDLRQVLQRLPRPVRWSAYYAVVAAVIFLGAHKAQKAFIYFQF